MAEATKNNSDYSKSLKATSLLGGVQVISIIVRVIRAKLIAILIGTEGMGVAGLLTSTTTLMMSLTNLGIGSSAVKNIAEAEATGDSTRLMTVISVFRKLVWGTGLLGLLLTIVLSPFLSRWTFGNGDYTIAFIILSSTLLITQLSTGQTAVMQGLHKYRFMAMSSLLGQIIGLIFTIPLYYIWRIDAIVPVLVLTSAVSLILSLFFYRKLNIKPVAVTKQQIKTDGKNMAIMGISIGFTGILSSALMYLLRVIINNVGGIDEVGLFTAGFTIVTTYVGLVINAMGTDYYPRLSAVNHDREKFNNTINNQMEIAFLLLGPILSFFIIFVHIGIIVLYSSDFLPAEKMIYWAVYAVFFQVFSWCISFSFLAKADAKIFVINEIISSIYSFGSKVLGYYLAGLQGIGWGYLFTYALYSLQVYFICSRKYGVTIHREAIAIFLKQLPIITSCLLLVILNNNNIIHYTLGVSLISLSVFLSYRDLSNRIDIQGIIEARIHKNRDYGHQDK